VRDTFDGEDLTRAIGYGLIALNDRERALQHQPAYRKVMPMRLVCRMLRVIFVSICE